MAFERLTEEVRNVSALPNVIVGQASTLKATFDEAGSDIKNFINNFLTALETFSAASNIGAMNGELQSNLQAIIDEFATSIANRYTKAEIDSKVSTETGDLVKTLDIDLNTGVFTITKKDGTVETIDTTLEKVPTNFAFVEENGMYYLKVTNTDGTSTQVDVTTLFNDYTFNNTDSIAFSTVKDGNEATITAEIRDASIGIEKLSLTAVSQLEGYVSSASQSAQTATTKANEASESATSALNSANNAATSATSAQTSATSAQTSANNAATSASAASSSAANATSQATLSQSWAVGNTGTRDGENTNNAKYWAEQARASSQGGDMKKSTYDTNGNGIVDNAEELGGQLPSYYAKAEDVSDLNDFVFTTIPNLDGKISQKATAKNFTATIPTTGWSSSAPYTNTITVSGMLASDSNFPVSPVYSTELATRKLQSEAWNKVTMIVAGADSIVVTCDEEIPATEIPIQITVVR